MERYRDNDGNTGFYKNTILPSGQTILIEFQEEQAKKCYYYGIYLAISNKRKSIENTDLKITGKDGLKGLLWAKRRIVEFESFIKSWREDIPITIYCYWDDNRRRDVYHYGLSKIGYRYGMLFGSKVLYKKIS